LGLAVPARPCLIVGKRVRIRGMRVFKFRSDHRSQNSGPFCPQRTVVSVSRGAGRYRSGSTATPAKRRLEKTLWPSQKRTRPIHAGGVLQVAAQLIGSFECAFFSYRSVLGPRSLPGPLLRPRWHAEQGKTFVASTIAVGRVRNARSRRCSSSKEL